MPTAISNTSPLLDLYRIEAIEILCKLFDEVWTVGSVKRELMAGQSRGYKVPSLQEMPWIRIVNPRSVPSEWLSLDLGGGELETIALSHWSIRSILCCSMTS